ncbi:DUF6482 family protein [Gilvimarinus algae]|uniref:DUF6482 family protein n=1 Tax=Gilvimarinus algae TaxID=3058037 RepID=A0ABT8T9Q8_9GAMM|nr:DUF6482 family protein [Gilvimarinus sp. SDUM040014]MDO3380837.1 DUF6482 family protein [Gilvimarinus sp. SDUM040014]
MASGERALILSYSDCTHYLAAYGHEPPGGMPDWQVIKEPSGRPKKFVSLYAVKCWWAEQGKTEAWLVTQSPYDEMIAGEGPVLDEMKLVIDPAP